MWHFEIHAKLPCQCWHRSTDVTPLAIGLSIDRLSLTSYYLNILQSPYHVVGIQLSLSNKLSVILSISHHYLPAIIYKPIIICKGYYVTITTPINKGPQLPLRSISTRFHLTLFILTHTLLTLLTHPLNKGHSQSSVWDLGAYLVHVHLDVGQLWISVSTFSAHSEVVVKHTPRPLFLTHG